MRVPIRQLLIDGIPEVEHRVYETAAAGPELNTPFLIIKEGIQDPQAAYAAYTTIVEVWPYGSKTTFQHIDRLAEDVIAALDKKQFIDAGIPHLIEYTGTLSADTLDEKWNLLTRGLQFRVFSLGWLAYKPTVPDPVIALKQWAEKSFNNLQTDPALWNPTDTAPALYWRQAEIQRIDSMNWGAWITAKVSGHVIAPDHAVRKAWVEQVVRQLSLDHKTQMDDGSRLIFHHVTADSGYDPFQHGQIQLEVRYGILKENMEQSFITRVHTDTIYGGVELGK